jgi:hypothetical protein
MKKTPLRWEHMKTRDSFSLFIYQLHETVNNMLHKKSGLTYEDVRERYEHFRARCAKTKRRRMSRKSEKGCTEPLYGEKAKCILKIVPDKVKCDTLQIDKSCIKRREA